MYFLLSFFIELWFLSSYKRKYFRFRLSSKLSLESWDRPGKERHKLWHFDIKMKQKILKSQLYNVFTKCCMKWLTSMSNITAARPVPRKMWKIAEIWTEKNGQTFHFHFLLTLLTASAHQGWGLTFVQSNSNCADDEHWTSAHWNSMWVIWMAL